MFSDRATPNSEHVQGPADLNILSAGAALSRPEKGFHVPILVFISTPFRTGSTHAFHSPFIALKSRAMSLSQTGRKERWFLSLQRWCKRASRSERTLARKQPRLVCAGQGQTLLDDCESSSRLLFDGVLVSEAITVCLGCHARQVRHTSVDDHMRER